MLNDARSLWSSASSVVQNIVASALTDDPAGDSGQVEDLSRELEIYKRHVEEMQLSLVELSKLSRMAVAEKEAELVAFKQAMSPQSSDGPSVQLLDQARLLADKTVLLDHVKELEVKLVEVMQEKSRIEVRNEMYDEVCSQLKTLKAEFTSILGTDAGSKAKSETVEGLVDEYSRLASEFELYQQQSDLRLTEVARENEVLAMKTHALEESLSELADRAKGSGSGASASNGEDVQEQLSLQLKEARSRIVNLQYDLKEVKLDLEQAKAAADVTTVLPTSVVHDAALTKDLSDSLQRVRGLEEEVSRLRCEKEATEQTNAQLLEHTRKLEADVKARPVQEPDSDGAASPFRVTLQAELTKNKADLAAKTQECAALRDTVASATTRASEAEVALKKQADESSRTEAKLRQELEAVSLRSREGLEEYASRELVATEQANKAVVVLNAELASIRLRSEQQEQGHEAEKGELRSRIRELEAELVSINAQASSAVDDTAERLKQQLASLKLEMEAERDALVADLTARHATDKEHALTELRLELELLATTREAIAVASTRGEWDQDISALRERQAGELATACESVRTEARALAEAELSRQLVSVRAQHEEFVQQLQASLNAEKTAALESLHESLAAEHSARVDELRQSHAEDLQRALLQKQTEAEAALADALSKAHEQSEERLTSALKELSDAKDQFLEDTMASATKIHLEEKALLTERLDALSRQLDETLKGLEESVRIAVFTAESLKEEQHAAAMTALRLEMQGAVDAAAEERDEYLRLYSKERDQRKVLHNRLLEIQGNIRVLCRVRPVLDVERRQGSGAEVDVTEVPAEDLLIIQRDPATRTRFEFDRVFTQGSGQEEVFAAVQPLCVSVLDGFNVAIFAYGQTGSGKTFTMEGVAANKGVAPRAVEELFRSIASLSESGDCEYSVRFSMLEIYNETIRDLLDSSAAKDKDKLDVRQTPEGVNIVQGLLEEEVTSAARVQALMETGQSNRAVGSHDMNEHSSRSHSILTLTCRGKNLRDGATTFGKLNLIDLAGSERLSKTDATGDRLKEAQNINRSLSALGDVINALGNKKSSHVPYRNSKLTFLLQDSLGGNSKVLMFVNISPAVYNMGETLCSLNFASRCRSVELGQAKKQSDDSNASSSSAIRRASLLDGTTVSVGSPGSVLPIATPNKISGRSSMGPGSTVLKKI